MKQTRAARARVALVDLSLTDCDRLDQALGERIEVALVVAASPESPVARWAEVAGYPWSTDLRKLSGTVADAIAVGADSTRRAEALALGAMLGARCSIVGSDRLDRGPDAEGISTGPAPLSLDQALEELLSSPPTARQHDDAP